ncbi:hypothetical protein LAZ67_14002293 [Cordylochernes scorpioides]|uniref:Transposase n=1 Tax=Cordylochernes scorpioides TaxID=51811 RepID=A0ABY6L6X2_9ARAC|nr:hypothetical protein LAZ67_14002293 [Cordylochernes scorpioides]
MGVGFHRRVKVKTSLQDDDVSIDDTTTKPLFTPQEKGRKVHVVQTMIIMKNAHPSLTLEDRGVERRLCVFVLASGCHWLMASESVSWPSALGWLTRGARQYHPPAFALVPRVNLRTSEVLDSSADSGSTVNKGFEGQGGGVLLERRTGLTKSEREGSVSNLAMNSRRRLWVWKATAPRMYLLVDRKVWVAICFKGVPAVLRWDLPSNPTRRQNVHDDELSGSPVTATDNAAVAAVRNVVEADRRVTIDEIMIRLPPGIEIRRSSIGTIMSDVLNFLKVCTRWVPRLLLENHKQQRMELSWKCIKEMEINCFPVLPLEMKAGCIIQLQKQNDKTWQSMAMENFKWEFFTHPPYSPELAPSDFHLYPALKWHLGGKHFANDDEVQAEFEAVPNMEADAFAADSNMSTDSAPPTGGTGHDNHAVVVAGRKVLNLLREICLLIIKSRGFYTLPSGTKTVTPEEQ